MNLELTGKLVEKYETQVVSDRFRKREFVLELPDETGNGYINYAKMQLVQTKCDIIDRFNMGDMLRVNFNIKGNRVERDGRTNYFSNLDAWRIEKADAANSGNGATGYQNQGQNQAANSGNGGYNNNGGNGGNWNNNNGGGNNSWNNNSGSTNAAPAYQNAGGAGNSGGFSNNAEQADDLPF